MPIEILMPALSPTMTEGTLATWQKREGEPVAPGDIIAEIETDKATMEVEAVDEGVMGRILVPAGSENVAVNTPIALLLSDGEDAASLDTPSNTAPAELASAPATEPFPMPPAAQAQSLAVASGPLAPHSDERILASPLAKRMAAQAGLDLASVPGTGPRGRIVKADIERALSDGTAPVLDNAPVAGTAAPASASSDPPAVQQAPPSGGYDEVPLNGMRKTIARRLSESKRDIPHFYLDASCRLDALLLLRRELNEREGADYKLSVNDFIVKAAALGLRRVPDMNASWGGDKVYRFHDVDVAVAVAVDGGLLTPVVRRADQKGLLTLSNEVKDLAARAKSGTLAPEEYQGGGFSISNLGMFGVERFSAVINPPQAAILAVGAGTERPVVIDGALAIATVMDVTLSVDHRVVDGALAARFLAELRGLIEDPMGLLL